VAFPNSHDSGYRSALRANCANDILARDAWAAPQLSYIGSATSPQQHNMGSLPNPGDPGYRQSLGVGGLLLRWSTAADRAGCILTSCLSFQDPEGEETEFAMRYFEPFTDDAFPEGSSCVFSRNQHRFISLSRIQHKLGYLCRHFSHSS
jgi:hypothetical protein